MTTTTRNTRTRTGAGAAPMPSAVGLGLARTGIELRQFFRERDAVVFIFAYPIIMLAIFATVFGQGDAMVGPDPGIPFAQYFLPGMVATGVLLSTFQNLAVAICAERDDGSLKRLRGMPVPGTSYFLGKIGAAVLTATVQTALLLSIAAVAFGVELPRTTAAWATFAWVFTLGTAAGAVLGIAFSSVPRSGKSAAAVTVPVVLILQFISGVFFAFHELPSWMQQVASAFPLKWMAQGMRSVFLPEAAAALEPASSWQHGATAAVLVCYLVVGLLVASKTFRWRRRDDG